MKCKPALLFLFMISAIPLIYGQNNTVSCGGDISNASGSVSYTVGQVVFNHVENTSGSVREGVQQTYSADIITGAERNEIQLSVFPNPTNERAVLQIEPEYLGLLNYSLFNAAGQLINTQALQNTETAVSLANLANGIYILSVDNGTKTIKSFRIVKMQ